MTTPITHPESIKSTPPKSTKTIITTHEAIFGGSPVDAITQEATEMVTKHGKESALQKIREDISTHSLFGAFDLVEFWARVAARIQTTRFA